MQLPVSAGGNRTGNGHDCWGSFRQSSWLWFSRYSGAPLTFLQAVEDLNFTFLKICDFACKLKLSASVIFLSALLRQLNFPGVIFDS